MYNAIVRPSRDLRNNYPDVIRSLDEHDHVIITNKGRGEAVLIGIEDYKAYEEFLHIRYINERLEASAKTANDPSAKRYSYEEFFDLVSE